MVFPMEFDCFSGFSGRQHLQRGSGDRAGRSGIAGSAGALRDPGEFAQIFPSFRRFPMSKTPPEVVSAWVFLP